MIPGFDSKAMKGLSVDENRLKRIKAIIQSMTKKERSNRYHQRKPQRIASGSGTEVQDVNRLLKDFEQVNKLMKMMNKRQKRAKRYEKHAVSLLTYRINNQGGVSNGSKNQTEKSRL